MSGIIVTALCSWTVSVNKEKFFFFARSHPLRKFAFFFRYIHSVCTLTGLNDDPNVDVEELRHFVKFPQRSAKTEKNSHLTTHSTPRPTHQLAWKHHIRFRTFAKKIGPALVELWNSSHDLSRPLAKLIRSTSPLSKRLTPLLISTCTTTFKLLWKVFSCKKIHLRRVFTTVEEVLVSYVDDSLCANYYLF